MPFLHAILCFVILRVLSKLMFDESISLVADVIISIASGFCAAVLSYVLGMGVARAIASHDVGEAKDRILFEGFLGALIPVGIFLGFCFAVTYGFSERLFDEFEYQGWGWAVVFFVIPISSHFVVEAGRAKRAYTAYKIYGIH